MALTFALTDTEAADGLSATITDATADYGTGGNQARGDAANYLLWSKTDLNGNYSFTNPSFGDPLSIMAWSVTLVLSGWYQGILLRIQPYDSITSYVKQVESGGAILTYESVVYVASSNKVYKCIEDVTSTSPVDSNGELFWEEVTDLSTIIGNTNIDQFIEDFYYKTVVNQCILEKTKAAECGCGCNTPLSQIRIPLTLRFKLFGADAEFANGNPEVMEKIIRDISATCPQC